MSKVRAVPAGYHTVTPALTVKGAADALAFYVKAFGAELVDEALSPDGKSIWHATFRVGDSMVMIADEMPSMGSLARATALWLYVDDVDAAFKRATDAGAKAAMPPTDMFWGDRFGKVVDAWGNEWSLATRTKELTPAEMKQAQDDFVASMAKKGTP